MGLKLTNQTTSVVQGVRWTYFAALLNGALQLLLLAVLARLVDPAEFGVLATALLVVKALQVLVQSGYERAIVWSEDPTRASVAGLFWLANLTGLLILIVVVILAAPISAFFRDPRLYDALILLAPMASLVAPGLISRGLLRRAMRFRELAIYEVASYFIGFVLVGLPLALNGLGLWALVAANLTQCAIQGLAPLAIVRHSIFVSFRIADVAAPMRFGYSVSGLGIIEFVDTQLTPAFIGHLYGMATLGTYNRAYALIQLPIEQIGSSLTRVLFSPFNRARGNPDELRQAALMPLRLLALIVFPVALGGAAAAETIVEVMLGRTWDSAVPIFVALCLGSAAAVLGNLLATMNEALNLIRQKAFAQISITTMLFLLQLSVGAISPVAAVICFTFSRISFLIAQVWIAAPQLNMRRLELICAMAPGFAMGIVVAGLIFWFEHLAAISALAIWLRLMVLIAIAGLATAVGSLAIVPELRKLVKIL